MPDKDRTLTDAEVERLREWYFGNDYDAVGLVAAVESILTARLTTAEAEKEALRAEFDAKARDYLDTVRLLQDRTEDAEAALAKANEELERFRTGFAQMGFCPKDFEAMPCTTCGAGL